MGEYLRLEALLFGDPPAVNAEHVRVVHPSSPALQILKKTNEDIAQKISKFTKIGSCAYLARLDILSGVVALEN